MVIFPKHFKAFKYLEQDMAQSLLFFCAIHWFLITNTKSFTTNFYTLKKAIHHKEFIMRQTILLILPALAIFLLLPLASPALAQSGGFQGSAPPSQGGFTGPGLDITTVDKALSMRDDTYVMLRGKITRSIGKDKYIFQDTTGELTVDIDKHVWAGQNVTPEDTIEISGEIDKEFMDGLEVDVHRLSVVK
jgi:uncharacterized protein (TIGR00156 family)